MSPSLTSAIIAVKPRIAVTARWIYQKTFSAKDRIAFYDMLAFLLDNNKSLQQALIDMRNVVTDFGRKHHPYAVLLTDCLSTLDEGQGAFEKVLLEWVPVQEATLIGSGILYGKLSDTLRRASQFNESAKQYIADHRDELLNQPLPYRITPSLLIKNGYLQQGFAEKNGLGQQYVTGVVKNNQKKPCTLQALTCSVQGDTLSEKGMRRIAAQITGMDGFVDEKNIANGAYGGWTSQPRDFGLDCRHGHIAIALSSEILGSVLQESDRLYRFKVKHKPELNRMYTYIDMGGNNLNNTNAVNAKNGHYSEEINTGGNIKTQGGWMITQHGKGWLNEAHGGGFYMDDNDWIRSVNNKGIYTGGQLKGGTVRADGRLFTGEFLQLDGTAQPSWGCNPNGLVGRTPEGALLYVKMDCGRRDLRCNNMNVNKWVTGVAVTSENIVAPLIGMLLVSNLWVINTKSRPTLLPAVSEVGHDWRGINGTVPLKNSGGPAQGNSAVD